MGIGYFNKLTIACTLAVFALSEPAFSENAQPPEIDGNFLLKACNSAVQQTDEGAEVGGEFGLWCFGYLSGFSSGTSLGVLEKNYQNKTHEQLLFCDGKIPPIETARIVVKFLEEHPQTLHMPAEFTMLKILENSFPCKDQN